MPECPRGKQRARYAAGAVGGSARGEGARAYIGGPAVTRLRVWGTIFPGYACSLEGRLRCYAHMQLQGGGALPLTAPQA